MIRRHLTQPLKITIIYLVIGWAWIAFSDYLLLLVIDDVEAMRLAQTYKGWLYVLATAVLLFFLVRQSLKKEMSVREKYLHSVEKALEKAEESNRLKTNFLNNLSHEIRTPMNSIIGFSDLLNNSSISGDERKKFTDQLQLNTRHLLNNITDIVHISRIEAGQEFMARDKIHIHKLLAELESEFSEEVDPLKVTFSCHAALPPEQSMVVADGEKLSLMLSHLIRNAVRFTEQGRIECLCQLEGDRLVFRVSDTGPGIHPDHQELIFKRFWQDEVGKDRVLKGLGLGLSIARELAGMMRGEIRVVSEPGKGAVFTLSIPCQPVGANQGGIS